MKEQLEQLKAQALAALQEASTPAALEDVRLRYLSKKGEVTSVLKMMGKLSAEERPIIGQLANIVPLLCAEKSSNSHLLPKPFSVMVRSFLPSSTMATPRT